MITHAYVKTENNSKISEMYLCRLSPRLAKEFLPRAEA